MEWFSAKPLTRIDNAIFLYPLIIKCCGCIVATITLAHITAADNTCLLDSILMIPLPLPVSRTFEDKARPLIADPKAWPADTSHLYMQVQMRDRQTLTQWIEVLSLHQLSHNLILLLLCVSGALIDPSFFSQISIKETAWAVWYFGTAFITLCPDCCQHSILQNVND